jgi:hypothetical protein
LGRWVRVRGITGVYATRQTQEWYGFALISGLWGELVGTVGAMALKVGNCHPIWGGEWVTNIIV